MIRKLLVISTMYLFTLNSQAQTYHFSQEIGTYTELTNDIQQQTFDGVNDLLDIGATFEFYGKQFDFNGLAGLAVGEAGFVSGTSNDGQQVFFVDGFFVSGNPFTTLNSNSKISYQLDGSAGNLILKIQWKDVAFQNGPNNEFVNFQIWLYQSNGNIEIHYGPSSVSNTAYMPASGPAIGIFTTDASFNTLETLFLIDGVSNPTIDDANVFATINGTPSEGVVYKFSTSAVVGLDRVDQFKSTVYPNPSSDLLFVESAESLRFGKVKDINGKTVLKGNLAGTSTSIDISTLENGVYFLEVQSLKGSSFSRFVKL